MSEPCCGTCAHWVHMASAAAPTFVLVEIDPARLPGDPIGNVVRRRGDCLIMMDQTWCHDGPCLMYDPAEPE